MILFNGNFIFSYFLSIKILPPFLLFFTIISVIIFVKEGFAVFVGRISPFVRPPQFSWADSSAGRAPHLQCGGLGFESPSVHICETTGGLTEILTAIKIKITKLQRLCQTKNSLLPVMKQRC